MAAFSKFNNFVQDLANKKVDYCTNTTDTFSVLLTNTAPNVADTVVDTTTTTCTLRATSTAPEIAAGNGYTKGGLTAGTPTGAQAGGTFTFRLATDPVWNASGGAIGPARYAVLYCTSAGTTSTRPLIGFWDYGSSVTINVGEPFTVDLDQTNGVFTIAQP